MTNRGPEPPTETPLPERTPLLEVSGPLTVKEVESLVFVAARTRPEFEASQRTWLEADRSYFIRCRDSSHDSALKVIGLIHAYQLPEMACRVTVIPFDDEPDAALQEYTQELREHLEKEGFQ